MRARAGVIVLENEAVALIERRRAGRHYFAFPGGGVDAGETPETAAVREAHEELGLTVELRELVAIVRPRGPFGLQYYFLAEPVGGEFGAGHGPEMTGDLFLFLGSHKAVWVPVEELLVRSVKPKPLAEVVVVGSKEGWPSEPLLISVD